MTPVGYMIAYLRHQSHTYIDLMVASPIPVHRPWDEADPEFLACGNNSVLRNSLYERVLGLQDCYRLHRVRSALRHPAV